VANSAASRRQTPWDEAKAVAAEWEKAGSWTGEVTVAESLPETPKSRRVAFATDKKYRLLTKLIEFSQKRGYAMIDEWEPTDVREFRTPWAINPQTDARRVSMLKPFFEYCLTNK
jgi:hypothetical protein